MSVLQSSSCYTRCKIWPSIAVTVSTILCRSCGKSGGIGNTCVRGPYATWFTVCGRNLITGMTSAASPRVHISSTCKVGQKLVMSLPLLTCSPSAWPSRLLYLRGRKSRGTYMYVYFVQEYVKYFKINFIQEKKMLCAQMILKITQVKVKL
jgi:hypothetical protein